MIPVTMNTPPHVAAGSVTARMRRMLGRNPREHGRAATPLELLFDLTFVVAFGIAGSQMAHEIAEGRLAVGLGGFAFGMFAIIWAWINFSWFASAFDTDDWVYRLTTMVQMAGVLVLALGLSDVFHSLEGGHGIDNTVVVAGYVIMRVAMLAQWLRLAAQSPAHRRTALIYATFIAIAQIGWVATAVLHLELGPTLAFAAVLYLIELGGPLLAERRHPTPWHPHHIAERYGLLVLIALGEGVLGTVTAVQPIIAESGWSGDAIVLVAAGVTLTFGMWWAYFAVPFGHLLEHRPGGGFVFGYLHMLVFAAVAAAGAGLHVGAYVVEGQAHVDFAVAVQVVAIAVAVFLTTYLAVAATLTRRVRRAHAVALTLALVVLATAVVLAEIGTSFALSILLVAAAPWVVVVGEELTAGRSAAASGHSERGTAAAGD